LGSFCDKISKQFLFVLALFVLLLYGSSAYSELKSEKVSEIRFGVIDPPVVLHKELKILAPVSNNNLEKKLIECSGLYWLNGYLLISSDSHDHGLFICPIDLDKMKFGEAIYYVVIRNEQELLSDVESISVRQHSNGGVYVYMMCSLGNDRYDTPLPSRRLMMRFNLKQLEPFTFDDVRVFDASKFRTVVNEHFKALGVQPYHAYTADFIGQNKNTYRWGHIEGMDFVPNSPLVICGMRNPLYEGNAFVFVAKDTDNAINLLEPDGLKVVDLFALDLGDRGFSDISWDPETEGYLIAAAKSSGPKLDSDQPYPPSNLDSALFWWSGRKDEQPILFARIDDASIEAVCRLGKSRFIAIGTDEGDIGEGRNTSQSVITIMDFTGVPGVSKE
jgi:hypothetical protein